MDFGNAAILIAAVIGIAALGKKLIWGTNNERSIVGVVLGASLLATFLVGGSVWAKEQVIGGQALDNMGVDDKLVVALFLAGVAAAAWETLGAVKNIGENQPK